MGKTEIVPSPKPVLDFWQLRNYCVPTMARWKIKFHSTSKRVYSDSGIHSFAWRNHKNPTKKNPLRPWQCGWHIRNLQDRWTSLAPNELTWNNTQNAQKTCSIFTARSTWQLLLWLHFHHSPSSFGTLASSVPWIPGETCCGHTVANVRRFSKRLRHASGTHLAVSIANLNHIVKNIIYIGVC